MYRILLNFSELIVYPALFWSQYCLTVNFKEILLEKLIILLFILKIIKIY